MPRSLTSAAVLFIGAALSLAGLAPPAAAQSFSPAPGTYVLSGPVTLADASVYTCTVTINMSVNAAGAATVTSRTVSGSGWCGLAVLPYGAWTIAPGPGSGATMVLGFSAGTRNCYGLVQASLLASPARLQLPQTDLPGAPLGCRITTGTLYASPSLTVVP